MGLLAVQGERSAALRVYQALSAALALDLDLAPGDEIESLRGRLLAQDTALPGTMQRPRATQTTAPTTLPAPLTSFIGRGWEQREVRELLATTRLLTLIGPGGCGRTRLALEVARALVDTYPDGVWLVELAALRDAALVPWAAADALGVQEQPGRTLEATLRDVLRPRRMLLVLDNCEHLIAGCAALAAALLEGCPDLRILATSREPLRSAGEMVWHVPPLSVPPAAVSPQPASLLRFETVRLFVERARASRPDFTVTAGNARAVLQVCQRLDGLPLAIELAAARLAVLPVDAVAARLDDCFALLTGGSRGAPPRQQTLRATMAWSYGLLAAEEQRLLRRLAVFTDGCTLVAAAAVCVDEGVPDPVLLDVLGGLISKSLVTLEERASVGRYRLLEMVRQYGWERLEEAGETGEVRDRHLEWCLALAEQAEPALTGPDQGRWQQGLEQERENLRSALGWARARGAIDHGLRLAGALWRFWWAQGLASEGRAWLEGLLPLEASAADRVPTPSVRAKALSAAAALATEQGDHDRAATLAEDGVRLYRRLGDTAGAARALGIAGTVALRQGDAARATALYEECLAVHRTLGDLRASASLLNNLAIVARDQGDDARATALFTDSLALKRTLGDKRGIAFTLLNLGEVALDLGDYMRASAVLDESLALLREQDERGAIPSVLNNLGDVARYQGDLGQAIILYKQSLTLYRAMGNRQDAGECLEGLAAVAGAQGQPHYAARLLGAAAALRAAMHIPLPVVDRAAHDRIVAAARTALGDDAFAAAWAAGQALPLEQAIDEALQVHHAV